MGAVLIAASTASAGVTDFVAKPTTKAPARPEWRTINLPAGRELTFAEPVPGRSGLTFACVPGQSKIEIRAPLIETSSLSALRLVSGGYVRVYFSRPADDQDREGQLVVRASAKDELIEAFRTSGRIMSGRVAMVAQTQAEKAAIKNFFAGCALTARAGLESQAAP